MARRHRPGLVTRRHRRSRLGGVAFVAAVTASLVAGAPAVAAVPTAILRVLVTGPAGEVASGARVDTGFGFLGTTDGQGGFVTAVDPAAVTQVCATLDPDSPLGGAAGWATTCRPVTVTPGTTTRVRLVMQPGAAISGRVTDARTGKPIAGAGIYNVAPGNEVDSRGTHTDADGVWTFRNLTPSPTALRHVNVAGPFADPYPSPARWGYVDIALNPSLPLRAGVVASGLDTGLVPIVRVRGTVIDSLARPVAGAAVTVRLDADTVDDTLTNSDGDYLLIVPWDSNGPVCASVPPNDGYPHGLARQCRPGLFRQRIEARADFTLEEGTE